jgi:3,4-dihydroxy 2-butanone 4-phosphate synthase/GTP cyclohydrolase II
MVMLKKIANLKQRVEKAVTDFSQGKPVLIGDDGKRENEVDLVFHASFATKELVNLAITHAKGLLCVALDHKIADKLGFYTAPRFPGGISHTNFTLTVDAKENITSGISALDRAHTIQLMANPKAQSSDFITPGHVFPLRAMDGGLSSRAGHTEALYELCALCQLPSAAAMCEILGEDGAAICPSEINDNKIFSKFTFISTVDLLWYKVFFCQKDFPFFDNTNPKENKFFSIQNDADFLSLPCAIEFHSQKFVASELRIVLNHGFSMTDNGVKKSNCCAEIVLFDFENLNENLPEEISEFCDLSAKIGLKNTRTSVKRLVSLLRALQFLEKKMEIQLNPEILQGVHFSNQEDGLILTEII